MDAWLQADDEIGRFADASEIGSARAGQCTKSAVDLRTVSESKSRQRVERVKLGTYGAGRDALQLGKGWSGNGSKSDEAVVELHFETIADVYRRDKRWNASTEDDVGGPCERELYWRAGEYAKHGAAAF